MTDGDIRAALERHWSASAAGDQAAEHEIYGDDAICEYPQSGERIVGRQNLQALRSHHPGKPSDFREPLAVKRPQRRGLDERRPLMNVGRIVIADTSSARC
jgi:hypothetical protein